MTIGSFPLALGANISRARSASPKNLILTDAQTSGLTPSAIVALYSGLASLPVESNAANAACWVIKRNNPGNVAAFRFALGSSDGNAAKREAQVTILGLTECEIQPDTSLGTGKRYDATFWASFLASTGTDATSSPAPIALPTDHHLLLRATLPNAASRFHWCDRYGTVIDGSPAAQALNVGAGSTQRINVAAWFQTPAWNFDAWVVFVNCDALTATFSDAQGIVCEYMEM